MSTGHPAGHPPPGGSGTPTERVRAELVGVRVGAGCCRRAEVAGMLRFVGQLHPHAGRVVLLAPVGSLTTAVRLQYSLHEVYGCAADILGPGGRPHARTDQTQRDAPLTEPGRTGGTYQVLVTAGGADLGRRTRLTDRAGRMVRGLPSSLVTGGVCDAAAVWRGAFLVAGVLKNGTVPGLTLSCPVPETAMALVGGRPPSRGACPQPGVAWAAAGGGARPGGCAPVAGRDGGAGNTVGRAAFRCDPHRGGVGGLVSGREPGPRPDRRGPGLCRGGARLGGSRGPSTGAFG